MLTGRAVAARNRFALLDALISDARVGSDLFQSATHVRIRYTTV